MKRTLTHLFLSALVGCGPALTEPIKWEPVQRYQPVDVRDLIAHEPKAVLAGDMAAFDGWLISGDDWRRVKDELRRLQDVLDVAYGQIEADRRYCSDVDALEDAALREAKAARWYAFAAGVGVGAGSCGVLGWGLRTAGP